MPSKKSAARQAQKTKSDLRKLKSLGLVDKVDLRKKPTPAIKRTLTKYKDVLTGKATVISADKATAAKYRKILQTKGDKIIVPRKTGERVSISKDGVIHTKRKAYGETVEKVIGRKVEKAKPVEGERTYYTIPMARGKKKIERRRFGSFEQLLHFMRAYDFDFNDWEKYIEVETVATDSARSRQLDKQVAVSKAASVRKNKAKKKSRRGKKK